MGVTKIDFRKSKPQLYADPWRGGVRRVCEFKGLCVGCRSRCYGFTDGEDDPRGVLGERHAWSPLGPGMGLTREHVACFLCMNEEPLYLHAIERAKRVERREAIHSGRLALAKLVVQRERGE